MSESQRYIMIAAMVLERKVVLPIPEDLKGKLIPVALLHVSGWRRGMQGQVQIQPPPPSIEGTSATSPREGWIPVSWLASLNYNNSGLPHFKPPRANKWQSEQDKRRAWENKWKVLL